MAKKRVGKYPLSFRQMAIERMKDCPSVSALAEELGIDRSNLRRYVLKNGFRPHRRRTESTRMQSSLALTAAEARSVIALRKEQGFPV